MPTLAAEKTGVPHAFDGVARTYDLLTGANPGYHRHLRISAERLRAPPDGRLLDLCCGTGSSTAGLRAAYPAATITGLDASAGMLERARAKPELRADFVLGDATEPQRVGLRGPYDAVLMAYGLRNLPDPDRGLANLRAIVKPGGTVVLHEYSVADRVWARWVWTFVCWTIIIPGGLLTSPRSGIYRYLWRSVLGFDGVPELTARLARAGFVDVEVLPMDGWQRGILHSFRAKAPPLEHPSGATT